MAYQAGYHEVSVYRLSLANLDRPAAEVDAVFDTMRACLHQVEAFAADDSNVDIRAIGETERLPEDLQQRFAAMSRSAGDPPSTCWSPMIPGLSCSARSSAPATPRSI